MRAADIGVDPVGDTGQEVAQKREYLLNSILQNGYPDQKVFYISREKTIFARIASSHPELEVYQYILGMFPKR